MFANFTNDISAWKYGKLGRGLTIFWDICWNINCRRYLFVLILTIWTISNYHHYREERDLGENRKTSLFLPFHKSLSSATMLVFSRVVQKASITPIRRLSRGVSNAHFSKTARDTGRKSSGARPLTNMLVLGVVGTALFVKTSEVVGRERTRRYMTDQEWAAEQRGLRRTTLMFKPGEVDIRLCVGVDNSQLPAGAAIINLFNLIENARQDGPYSALLNEQHSRLGAAYIAQLPTGLVSAILREYFREHCKIGDHLYIQNFPASIPEANKFENEISQVSKVYVSKAAEVTAFAQYYAAVEKLEEL